MKQRMNFSAVASQPYKILVALEEYLSASGLDPSLRELVKLRASQINGCAFCIDMHWKDARAMGESEQRLYGLSAWEESAYYTPRERAALAWTEAVTQLHEGHVPDSVYEAVRPHFDEKALVDLTYAITAINSWNRLCVAFRAEAGSYVSPKNKAAS